MLPQIHLRMGDKFFCFCPQSCALLGLMRLALPPSQPIIKSQILVTYIPALLLHTSNLRGGQQSDNATPLQFSKKIVNISDCNRCDFTYSCIKLSSLVVVSTMTIYIRVMPQHLSCLYERRHMFVEEIKPHWLRQRRTCSLHLQCMHAFSYSRFFIAIALCIIAQHYYKHLNSNCATRVATSSHIIARFSCSKKQEPYHPQSSTTDAPSPYYYGLRSKQLLI